MSQIRKEPTSYDEFQDVALLCSDYPQCLRIVPSIIGYCVETVWEYFIRIMGVSPDPFSSQPVTLDQRLYFANFLVSLFFRIGCGMVIWFSLNKLFCSPVLSHLISSLFLFLLIAPHAMMIKFVSDRSDLYNQELTWLWQMISIFFIYYDYFALAVIFLTLYKFRQMVEQAYFVQILIGIFLFFSFEFLPVFYFGVIFFSKEVRARPKHLLCLLPGAFTLIIISILENSSNGIKNTYSYYFFSNFTNLDATLAITFVTLAPPFLLGKLTGLLLARQIKSHFINSFMTNRDLLSAALKSLILIHLMSLFTSGVNSEFGRQSLALQIIIMLFGLTKNSPKNFALPNHTQV